MFWSLAHKALRVKSISDIEHVSTLLQDGAGLLLVHHGRREQRQARVVMFFVVPTKKSLRESATVLNAAEAVGKLRTIFHGAELTLRVAPAVSQRTPVSCSMRRSGHPSRPRAITCCFFASLKTLLISTKAKCLTPKSTSRASFSLAGFQVTLIGRFWVTPEDGNSCTLTQTSVNEPVQIATVNQKVIANLAGTQLLRPNDLSNRPH